jgi:tryptophan-rich sensory protein
MRPKTLVSTVGAVFATATLGSLASPSAGSAWYARLKKPSLKLSTRIWQLNRD